MSNTNSVLEWALQHVAGTYSSAAEAADRLRKASVSCRLIGGMSVAPLVQGHEIMVSVIPIDPADTYPIRQSKKEEELGLPTRRGIGKATIMTVALAVGVEWVSTDRLGPEVQNLYRYRATGRYRAIDGQYRVFSDEVDIDLRKGSDQIASKSDFEVQGLRANGNRAAITKSRLRAMRSAFGIPHGALERDLDRPFVFSKVIFTGRSEDPSVRRMFAQVIAMQQLAATAAMYGGSMPSLELPQLQAPEPVMNELPSAAPVVITTDGEVVYPGGSSVCPEPPSAAPMGPHAPPASPPRHAGASRTTADGKRHGLWPWNARKAEDPAKGTPLDQVDSPSLTRLAEYYDKNPGDEKWAAKNAALAAEARSIVAARSKPAESEKADPAPAAAPTAAPAPALSDTIPATAEDAHDEDFDDGEEEPDANF